MDTVHIYKGEPQTGQHDMAGYRAWREDEKLFGLAILNCRGPMSTWLIAAKAIQEAGVRLKGDPGANRRGGRDRRGTWLEVPGMFIPGHAHWPPQGHRLSVARIIVHSGQREAESGSLAKVG